MLRWLASLVLWVSAGLAMAAERPVFDEPNFVRVGDPRSIADGVVTALAEDDAGFLWVGTAVGVMRHDGYRLVPFTVGQDLGARAPVGGTRFVRTLLAAPEGLLWVGLEGEGLARLDTRRQTWTLFRPDPGRAGALARGTVRALALDADGVLWVGTTGGGLQSLAPGQPLFKTHNRASGDLPDDRVQALKIDRRGTLWVGTWRGLVRRVKGGTGFEAVQAAVGDRPQGLSGLEVSMLGEGPDGRLWVGTRGGGLALLDPVTGAGDWAEPPAPGAGAENAAGAASAPAPGLAASAPAHGLGAGAGGMASFLVASADEVWIGRERGLELRNARTGALTQALRRALHKPWGLAGHNVVALLRDASGQLWVGSYGGGLQRHLPNAGLWVRRGDGPGGGAFAEADVRSLAQLRDGHIWAGTPDGAVLVFDRQLALVAQVLPGVGPSAGGSPVFGGGMVGAIAEDRAGQVWVGSDTGIYVFSPDRQLLRRIALGGGRPRRLLAAADGSVWAGTQDGVHRLAPGAAAFERVARADGQALSGNVNALVQDQGGALWVGGNAGLWRVPPGGSRLEPVATDADAGLGSPVVVGLLLDRQGQLWVDTNAGLHRWRRPGPGPARFEALGAATDGNSFGANLLEDADGRIWSHVAMFDPRDGRTVGLGQGDGVDIGTGWFRSYTRLADGRLLYGGSTGILVVEPSRLQPWAYAPPVAVAELRVNGLRQPSARLQPQLVLAPGERDFSLEVAALDLTEPMRNRYRYRMAGVQDEWVATAADFRVIGYGNLPPGDYLLEVQGSNRNGTWSPRSLQVAVRVLPAWWQTWWARLLLLLGAGAAVWALVQLRTGWLRRSRAELEGKVRERTQALERLSAELQHKSAALEASSLTDPLTGLHNRRYLMQHVAADAAQALRRHAERAAGGMVGHMVRDTAGDTAASDRWPPPPSGRATEAAPARRDADAAPVGPDLVFFLIDLDHFKSVNDAHGHAAGDAVLRQVCARLRQAFREADHVVRWGGEEFLVAARGTDRARAGELAERARAALSRQPFLLDDGQALHLTASVGFAAFPLAPTWPEALDWSATVDLADAALYRVKRDGRDGWFGLVGAEADDAQALRQAARQPLAQWLASGRVRHAASRDFRDT